jgi:hypothetical protein
MVEMRKAPIGWVVALAASIAVASCGGSEKNQPQAQPGSGPFSTGIAGSKPLGSLTDAEAQALCQASESFARTMMTPEMTCRAAAIGFAGLGAMSGTATDAEIQQTCSSIYGMCVAGGGSVAPATDAGTSTCTNPPANCTTTVAEYEACMNDTRTSLQQSMSAMPTCATLTVAWVLANSGDAGSSSSTDPPSCQAASAKCPGWQPSSTNAGP